MIKIFKYIIIATSVIIFILPLYAEETQEDHQVERYETIKKTHLKEYNSGIYNEDKKDYVNSWINQDINYQKKAIKLKSDYFAWAKDKISRGEDVIYNEYISLKTYTQIEKEILLEYHNKHFKGRKKSTSVAINNPVTVSNDNKKIIQNKKIIHKEVQPTQKKIKIKKDISENKKEINYLTGNNDFIEQHKSFTLFIFLIIIIGYYLIKKNLKHSMMYKKHSDKII